MFPQLTWVFSIIIFLNKTKQKQKEPSDAIRKIKCQIETKTEKSQRCNKEKNEESVKAQRCNRKTNENEHNQKMKEPNDAISSLTP